MALTNKHNKPVSPEEDEWGFYNPQEAGLPAVLGRIDAKIDESAASYAARMARTLRAANRPAVAAVPPKKPALARVPARKTDGSK